MSDGTAGAGLPRVRGFPRRRRTGGGPGRPLAALPHARGVFAEPAAHVWLAASQFAGIIRANDYAANYLPAGAFADEEISVTGAAGTLFTYRTDILHRGSRMTAERSALFTMSAHYDVWGPRWTGRVAWAEHTLSSDWGELIDARRPESGRCSGSRLRATRTGTSKRWPLRKRATPGPT